MDTRVAPDRKRPAGHQQRKRSYGAAHYRRLERLNREIARLLRAWR